jgi:predicted  nucleic acid-binding Zn-ribbon protein
MDILETLRERYRLDPTVQQAADEIKRLRHEFRELHADISMFMKDGPLKQDVLESIEDVLGDEK